MNDVFYGSIIVAALWMNRQLMNDYWEGRFANRPYNDNGMCTDGISL